FQDQTTWDEVRLSKEDLGDNAGYISPDDDFDVNITFYEGKAVGVNLPIKVVRTITYCEPGIKGDTSGKSLKPATLDTGAEIRVPLFCNTDDRIVIDTREGTFVERAKDK
ncbi:MAG: elongation factor P, partial [Treponema sp.]|nr:elongation factor P [Treponema sp.]